MTKVYVACKEKLSHFDIIAAFENEGDALQCADKHKEDAWTTTWVEEVNYYEHE